MSSQTKRDPAGAQLNKRQKKRLMDRQADDRQRARQRKYQVDSNLKYGNK